MKRLLIVRLSALGDVIHTIPAVVALRRALPDVEFDWVVERPYAELVELVAGVRAIPVSLKKWPKSPIKHRRELAAMHRALRGHDGAIDFQGLIKASVLARWSGASLRFGFDHQAIRERPAGWFLNRRVGVDQTKHVIDWNFQLALAVVPDLQPIDVDFSPYADDPTGKLRPFENAIVLLPGAGRPEKLWPVEHFRELSRHLGENVVVAWGPGEQHLADAIGGRIAPPTTLRELAHLLLHARLVIGGDTGPLHLAVALGKPVIGLFGPTNPARNGPYGQLQNCVESWSTTKSMQSITVEGVLRRVEEGAKR